MSLALAPSIKNKLHVDLGGPYYSTFLEKRNIYVKQKADLVQIESNEEHYQSWVQEIKDDIRGRSQNFNRLKFEYDQLVSQIRAEAKRIVVLIDGDGYIFPCNRVNAGRVGGLEAADELCNLLTKEFGTQEAELHVYIWLNKRKLADTMSANWNVDQNTMRDRFDSFVRAFNGSRKNFNIIDAGGQKQAADTKLLVLLESETFLPRTKRIVFGGCHDKGYATSLQFLIDAGFKDKLTLLLGYDGRMLTEYQNLRLPAVGNKGVFIPHRLPLPPASSDAYSISTYYAPSWHRPSTASSVGTGHRRQGSTNSMPVRDRGGFRLASSRNSVRSTSSRQPGDYPYRGGSSREVSIPSNRALRTVREEIRDNDPGPPSDNITDYRSSRTRIPLNTARQGFASAY